MSLKKRPLKASKALPSATPSALAAPHIPFTHKLTQWVLLFFAATLPLYFDLSVPEVSGDIRWAATSFFAGLCALLLLTHAWRQRPEVKGKLIFPLHGPVLFWVMAGLALWAAISLVDALNWMRGIILIKALYAQLILALCVWAVAKPVQGNTGFAHRLLWALAAPLSITAFIGILQFHGYTQATFDAALTSGPYIIFWPFLKALGWLTQGLNAFIPEWPNTADLVTQLTGFFLQSAVPGGSFANKNLAGSYTAMMIPLMVYLVLSSRRWWEKGLASALLSLGMLFLIYARARASWLALMAAFGVGIILILATPKLRHTLWNLLSWKAIAWFLLPLAILFRHGGDISPIYGSYAIDRTPAQQLAALGSASGGWNEYGGRLAYNLNSLAITADHWFNGVGLGSFFAIYPAYYNAIVTTPTNSYNMLARPQRTHTDFMQAFDEMGIPGGTFYVLFFALAIAMGFSLLGARAGRLAGALIGAGFSGTLMLLTLFLSYRGMLQLPLGWHIAFVGLLLGLTSLQLWRGNKLFWAMQRPNAAEAEPLTDWHLAGFFGTLGLLTICLNAFLDFPMQLPTAPAAAALLVGLLLALHGAVHPTRWLAGFKGKTFTLPRKPALAVLIGVLTLSWVWALYDAHQFREGNRLLKVAMGRIYAGVIDDTTLMLMEQANTVYALDPRIHENMGVTYANYKGTLPFTTQQRIDKLEWVAAGDPWAPNHLVNLAGQYIQLIQEARAVGQTATADKALLRLADINNRLMRTSSFSAITWGVAGICKLMENKPAEAVPLLQRALTIDPTYAPAISAYQSALSLTGISPVVVNDAALQRLR